MSHSRNVVETKKEIKNEIKIAFLAFDQKHQPLTINQLRWLRVVDDQKSGDDTAETKNAFPQVFLVIPASRAGEFAQRLAKAKDFSYRNILYVRDLPDNKDSATEFKSTELNSYPHFSGTMLEGIGAFPDNEKDVHFTAARLINQLTRGQHTIVIFACTAKEFNNGDYSEKGGWPKKMIHNMKGNNAPFDERSSTENCPVWSNVIDAIRGIAELRKQPISSNEMNRLEQEAQKQSTSTADRKDIGTVDTGDHHNNLYANLLSSILGFRRWETARRIFSILGFAFLLAIMIAGLALARGLMGADLLLGVFFGCFALAKVGEGICAFEAQKKDAAVRDNMEKAYQGIQKNKHSGILLNILFYVLPSLGMAFVNFVMSAYWLNQSWSAVSTIGELASASVMANLMPFLMLICLVSTAICVLRNQRNSEIEGTPTLLSGKAYFWIQIAGTIPTFVAFIKFNMFMSIGGLGAAAGAITPVGLLILCVIVLALIAIYKFRVKTAINISDQSIATVSASSAKSNLETQENAPAAAPVPPPFLSTLQPAAITNLSEMPTAYTATQATTAAFSAVTTNTRTSLDDGDGSASARLLKAYRDKNRSDVVQSDQMSESKSTNGVNLKVSDQPLSSTSAQTSTPKSELIPTPGESELTTDKLRGLNKVSNLPYLLEPTGRELPLCSLFFSCASRESEESAPLIHNP